MSTVPSVFALHSRWDHRLLLAAAVVFSTLAFVLTLLAQPSDGTVVGVCTDAKTGLPLAHVSVTLTRHEPLEGSDNGDAPGTASQNARGATDASAGWTKDTASDDTLDAAGNSNVPRDEWSGTTDAQGRFTLPHVSAGEYDLEATSSGHDLRNPLPVVVTDNAVAHITVPLDRVESHLGFVDAALNWLPDENPDVSLYGLLMTRTVHFSVDRLDTAGALARQPEMVASPASRDSTDDSVVEEPTWADEFTPVRHWTYTVTQADAEGSFSAHVPLGALAPGLYRVTAQTREGGRLIAAVGWARVTRLALVRKTYPDHILAYVADIATGHPVANLPVTLYDQGQDSVKTLAQAQTSPDGLVKLATTGAGPESRGVLVAQDGGSVTALALDLNSPGAQASDADDDADGNTTTPTGQRLRAFIYTDRPVYRPGQTAYVKGIARWFSAQQGFSVPAHQAVTLDVRDAQDTLISHQQVTTDDMGSWDATVPLSSEALTGDYTVHAALGGASAEANFSVAAYHKPEYQATVTFARDRYIRGETIEATVTATYFYGAPVSGAKVSLNVYRGAAPDAGDTSSDAGDSTADGGGDTADSGEPVLDETVTLDGSGQTHLRVPTRDAPPADGDQSYTVTADVDDSSGPSVHAESAVTVAQGLFSLTAAPSVYVAAPGTPVTVTVQATQQGGAPQAGQDVQIQAGYDVYQDDKDTFTALSDTHVSTSAQGQATATVPAPRSGLLSLRLTSTDARGNRVTAQADVWVASGDEDIPARLPDLSVVLDKRKYAPGEVAHLLINTAHPGPSALVTVEGDTLYRAMIVQLARHSTSVDLPVGPEDAPGVTVRVCCVNDKQFLSSDAPLVVSDLHRALRVSVAADRVDYHPGDPATLRVLTLDDAGHPVPAEVSVGVVDSAVYAIQPEPPGTIADAMLPAQGDGVTTDDSCEVVSLGDVDKGATNIDIRRNFPDTALWKPDVRTGSDGTATVRMALPDTLTTWRITCVGHTADTLVGKGVGTMTVSKDLLVRLETPPFLTAGDSGTLTALVHNNTRTMLHATVRLAATGLTTQDSPIRTVDVAPGVPARLTWNVAAAQPVPVTVQLTAQAGSLSDGVSQPIVVLPHGANQDIWESGTVTGRVSQDITLDPAAIPGATTLHVRLSPSISSALLPAVDYLASYPYGSTDSTVSAFVPDVILLRSAPGLNLPSAERAKLADQVRRSVLRLARMQNGDGGWGWFVNGRSDLWMTADAVWGQTLARDAGFPVRADILSGAARQLKSLSETPAWKPSYDGRFSLAALALADLGETDRARRILHALELHQDAHPEDVSPTDLALGVLAAQKLGDADFAQSLMADLWAECRRTGSLCSWTVAGHRSQQGVSEDLPDAEPTAWALLAALSAAPSDPRVDGIARWLMTNRTGDHWSGLIPTAVAVLGLAQYMDRAHEMQSDFDAHLIVNGQVVRALHFAPRSVLLPDRLINLPGSVLRPGVNTIALEKSGPGRLYYSLDLRQCLRRPAPPAPPTLWTRLIDHIRYPGGVPLPPAPSGCRVKRVYLRLTSRRSFLWEDTVPAPDTHLNAGESVLVRLIVDCTRPASRVMIEEPVPAGCRIAEVSGEDVTEWDNWWDYTDVRDDQIVFFVSDLTRGEHEIDYHLQAQTPGTFDVMPTQLSSAVDPTLSVLGPHADRLQIDPTD